MKIVEAVGKEKQKAFLAFRRKLYENKPCVDNSYFMIKEVFAGKMAFLRNVKCWPMMVMLENKEVVCEGILFYTPKLPEYMQIAFFESLGGSAEAVNLLFSEAERRGRKLGAKKLVAGLYGHVNYGLGFLSSHFDERNSFSSPYNPSYYDEIFRNGGFETIGLNTYIIPKIDDRLEKYRAKFTRMEKEFTYCTFQKRRFKYWSKIYTDLNNECFKNHRYYYPREYDEDREMLKELFSFMKEDSVIFAFHNGEPAGFVMWYPDFNELAKPGEIFGAKHFFRKFGRTFKTGKLMEFGVCDAYKRTGLVLGLVDQAVTAMKKSGCITLESSWVLAENKASNNVCSGMCDSLYKEYSVYEKDIPERDRGL